MPHRAVGNSSSHLQELSRGSASSTPDPIHRVLECHQELSLGAPQAALCAAPGPAEHCHLIPATAEHCQGTPTLLHTWGQREAPQLMGTGGESQLCAELRLHCLQCPSAHVVSEAWSKQRHARETWPSCCLCQLEHSSWATHWVQEFYGFLGSFFTSPNKSALDIMVIRANRILLESASFLQA